MDFQGVFAVLCTPFAASGELDEPSLRREVRFCLDCGTHGLVAGVVAGEFYTLADDERKRLLEIVAEENAGRVPLVAGCSGLSAPHSVLLARHAEAHGADAVMSVPPVVRKSGGEEIVAFYRALSDVLEIPIVIQDFILPVGTPMAPELMARMVREIPQVRFLKEETAVGPQVLTRLRELCGEQVEGIMGGQGGRSLFNEYARGTCGTMPACHLADIQVDIWSRLAGGDAAGARALWNRILPLTNFEAMYQVCAYKEVLRRRGVFATNLCRGGPAPLDAYDVRELDAILEDIDPLYRVHA